MPYRMLFGHKECRVKFTQPVDRKAFVRVCGNNFGACARAGHNLVQEKERVKEGFYGTAHTVKCLDGKLATFQSAEERNTVLLKEKEDDDDKNDAEAEEAEETESESETEENEEAVEAAVSEAEPVEEDNDDDDDDDEGVEEDKEDKN
jgi:hypothetical protein